MAMTLDDLHLDKFGRISPEWWGAVAAAAAAGAMLWPGKRLLGGLGLGAALLALAYTQAPCCSGCAGGGGCAGAVSSSAPTPTVDMGTPTIPTATDACVMRALGSC